MHAGAVTVLLLLLVGGCWSQATITSVSKGNCDGTGLITVIGTSFGGDNPGIVIGASESACTSFTLVSSTEITCIPPAGTGSGLDIQFKPDDLSGFTATLNVGFSYETPSVTSAVVGTTGGVATVAGTNFGASSNAITVTSNLSGGSSSYTGTWVSNTQVTFTAPAGSGSGFNIQVSSTAGQGALASGVVSYSPPSISNIDPRVGELGGRIITISGSNFGGSVGNAAVTFGSASCAVSSVNGAHDVLECTAPTLADAHYNDVVVTVSSQTSASDQLEYLTSPAITGVTGIPSTAGTDTVTIDGTDFGISAFTFSATVSSQSCTTVTFVTSTQVKCIGGLTQGGGNKSLVVTKVGHLSQAVSSSAYTAFSYKAPTATSATLGNTDGSSSVTIIGSNFGNGIGAYASIGSIACQSSSAVSNTKMLCQPPAGAGTGMDITVTVDTGSNALSGAAASGIFSYNAPVATLVTPSSGNAAGGYQIVISGSQFGPASTTVAVEIQHDTSGSYAACTSPVAGQTQITCVVPAGVGTARNLRVTVAGQSSSANNLFSFNPPTISSLTPNRGATDGSTSITISGINFGHSASDVGSVTIDGVACGSVTYVADTSIVCNGHTSGSGISKTVSVSLTGITAATSTAFSYKTPTISSLDYVKSYDSMTVTMMGSNFGPLADAITVSVNGNSCSSLSRLTYTSIQCVVPAGSGENLPILVTVAGQTNTAPSYFSYRTPLLTAMNPFVSVRKGGVSVTIEGSGFGDIQPTSITANMMTSCSWQSSTKIICSPEPVPGVLSTPDGHLSMGTMAISGGSAPIQVTLDSTHVSPADSKYTFYLEDCEAGEYQDTSLPSAPFCSPCPAGYYTSSSGQVECTACLPGTYADTAGSSFCKSCSDGEWSCYAGTVCTEDETSSACCGNGYVEDVFFVEDCDDGNDESGDGCSEICKDEIDEYFTPLTITAAVASPVLVAAVFSANANNPTSVVGVAAHMQGLAAISVIKVPTMPSDARNMAETSASFAMLQGNPADTFGSGGPVGSFARRLFGMDPQRRLSAKADGSDSIQGEPDDSMAINALLWVTIGFTAVVIFHATALVGHNICCKVVLRRKKPAVPGLLMVPYLELLFFLIIYQALCLASLRTIGAGNLSPYLYAVVVPLALVLFAIPFIVFLYVFIISSQRLATYQSSSAGWMPLTRAYEHTRFILRATVCICGRETVADLHEKRRSTRRGSTEALTAPEHQEMAEGGSHKRKMSIRLEPDDADFKFKGHVNKEVEDDSISLSTPASTSASTPSTSRNSTQSGGMCELNLSEEKDFKIRIQENEKGEEEEEEEELSYQPRPTLKQRTARYLITWWREFNIAGEWDMPPHIERSAVLFADYTGFNRYFLTIDLLLKFLRAMVVGLVVAIPAEESTIGYIQTVMILMIHAFMIFYTLSFGVFVNRHQTLKEVNFQITTFFLLLAILGMPQPNLVKSEWSLLHIISMQMFRFFMVVNVYGRYVWEYVEFFGKVAGKLATVLPGAPGGILALVMAPVRKFIIGPIKFVYSFMYDLMNTLFGSDDALDQVIEMVEDEIGGDASDDEVMGGMAGLLGVSAASAAARDVNNARLRDRVRNRNLSERQRREAAVMGENMLLFVLNSAYRALDLPLDAGYGVDPSTRRLVESAGFAWPTMCGKNLEDYERNEYCFEMPSDEPATVSARPSNEEDEIAEAKRAQRQINLVNKHPPRSPKHPASASGHRPAPAYFATVARVESRMDLDSNAPPSSPRHEASIDSLFGIVPEPPRESSSAMNHRPSVVSKRQRRPPLSNTMASSINRKLMSSRLEVRQDAAISFESAEEPASLVRSPPARLPPLERGPRVRRDSLREEESLADTEAMLRWAPR